MAALWQDTPTELLPVRTQVQRIAWRVYKMALFFVCGFIYAGVAVYNFYAFILGGPVWMFVLATFAAVMTWVHFEPAFVRRIPTLTERKVDSACRNLTRN